MEAARRNARPTLGAGSSDASTVQVDGGHAVTLDGKPVHTPARDAAAPSRALGEAIAAEWEAQHEAINPATMPLTRLANVIIDGVAKRPQPVAAELASYLASDLLFYRAASPAELVDRQRRDWDPILDWAAHALGASFRCVEGITFIAQPEAALSAAEAAIPRDPWQLGAVHAVTTLTGSALIALALARSFPLDRGSMAGRRCRRGLEHGAMGSRRACAGATSLPLCRIAGGGDGTQVGARFP